MVRVASEERDKELRGEFGGQSETGEESNHRIYH